MGRGAFGARAHGQLHIGVGFAGNAKEEHLTGVPVAQGTGPLDGRKFGIKWEATDGTMSDGEQRRAYRRALGASSLPHTTRLLLHVLLDYGMTPWPSEARIARDAGLSRRSVIRHLAQAEAAGWLAIERRIGKDGRRLTNRYVLTIPNVYQAQVARSADGADRAGAAPRIHVTDDHLGHVTTATEPCDNEDKNHVTGWRPNPKLEPQSESEKEEPDARARARAMLVAPGNGARLRAAGDGSADAYRGEAVADDALLEAAADYLGIEEAQKAMRAFARWAKGKTVRKRDRYFISFFRTYTKRLGLFGSEGVTLNENAIRQTRATRRP